MASKKTLAVIVPIYRPQLNSREEERLQVSADKLDFEWFFVGPESLDRDYYYKRWPRAKHEMFPDSDFSGRGAYNRLMLKPDLYDRFRGYVFILIVQLDAIVIRGFTQEQLLNLRVDYIGAPWIPGFRVSWNPLNGKVKEGAFRLTERWVRVGNGGLSLRRVSSFRRVTRLLPGIKRKENEDKIFSYFSRLLLLRIPSPSRASHFFMEQGAREWAPGDDIPYVHGFHGLDKFNPDLERELISRFSG